MTAYCDPNIQVVKTPKGLTAWLVQSPAIPMVSVEVAFRAGAAFDPKDAGGVAHLTSALLDEGAGSLTMSDFQEKLDEIGARFSAGIDPLNLVVNLTTLKENQDEAFRLMGLAVTAPRFDEEPIDRLKDAVLTSLRQEQERPNSIASKAFQKALYGDHPYANPANGTPESVSALTRDDIYSFWQKNFTRANMVISVVGDIDADTLAPLLDAALGDLPEGDARNVIAEPPQTPVPQVIRIEKDIPQSSILFGHLGIDRHDPDYFATYVMNDILGGGGFLAWFMEEVREKRGLAYGAYSAFVPMPHAGSFVAQVQTSNDKVDEVIRLMKEQMVRMKTQGVAPQEFEDDIQYLTGSFPLRIDSNDKILGYLSVMQLEDLGRDYLARWTDRVKALKVEDMQRVAQRLLHPDDVVTVIVGGTAE